ncbi:mRNA-degrading endonuclease RelE, toxin component of the RelBE toxin-antitoxin system [Candidatus Methanophagaceae archaeon]|jgi:mRNA-degrading endonuclease RelE of RelBE toxin-antitoxin system|nr:mRNA-degrading endonuclease RelE, toxin component of the RelBE toxin-antitoxin system [Methanophagales archaeon]
MLAVEHKHNFLKKTHRINDKSVKERVKNQIKKIIENPEIGKPMRYARKGTRELYIGSFRLSYAYLKSENKIIFLDLYHKDEQ